MSIENKDALEPIETPDVLEKKGSAPSRKRSIVIFVVVSMLNIALLALLWTQLLTPGANAPQNQESLVGNISSPLQGKQAPDFTLPLMNGTDEQLRLADFKGQVVLLNFWASNCPPCHDEAPLLQDVWTKLQTQDQEVVLIGINIYDLGEEEANAFLQTYGITYPNVRATDSTVAISYGTTGQPETFLIDTQGDVVARWQGELRDENVRGLLANMDISY